MRSTLRTFWAYQTLSHIFRLLRGGEASRSALMLLLRPKNLFQPFATTGEDRHPMLFEFVRQQLGDGPHRRLLSFGCSSGSEVLSLRKHFASAVIHGIDINPWNIWLARRLAKLHPALGEVQFVCAATAESAPARSYDAVFALSVFRHGRLGSAPERCDHLIHFSAFEDTLKGLVRRLKPGGILAICHANFRFTDCDFSQDFELVLPLTEIINANDSPLYGRGNSLLAAAQRDDGVYRRHTPGLHS